MKQGISERLDFACYKCLVLTNLYRIKTTRCTDYELHGREYNEGCTIRCILYFNLRILY